MKKLEPGTYQSIAVEAVQVTEENLEQVAEWCRGSVKGRALQRHERAIDVWCKYPDMEMRAEVGDYVVQCPPRSGFFLVFHRKTFERMFQDDASKVGRLG